MNLFLKKKISFDREKYVIFFGLALIYFYYLYQALYLNLSLKDNFFLSFNYTTASEYIYQLTNILNIFFVDYQGSNLLIQLPDFILFKIIGFNNLWSSAIIYKTILYFLLILVIKNLFNLKNNHLIIWIFIVVISLCSGWELFIDRLFRNSISIILYSFIIIYLYYLFDQKKIASTKCSIILSIFSSLLVSSDPWSFIFLIPLFILNFKNLIPRIYLMSFFFIIFLLPVLYVLINQKINGSNYSDYLGSKIIFDKLVFYKDYLFKIFQNKEIIILLLFNFFINLYSKKNKNTLFLIIVLLIAPIFLILMNYTIQSYHLLEGATNFIVFFTYLFFLSFLTRNNLFFMKGKWFFLIIIFLFSVYLYFLNFRINPWLDRTAQNISLYKSDYQKISQLNKSCIIISSDFYIGGYSKFLKFKILPEHFFFRKDNVDEMKKHIKFLLYFLNIKDVNKITEFYYFAGGGLYFNTRSTSSKIVTYSTNEFKEKLNKIDSMSLWKITVPEKDLYFKNIKNFVERNKLEYYNYISSLKNYVYLENNKVISSSSTCKI